MRKIYGTVAATALFAIGVTLAPSHPAAADITSTIDVTLPTVMRDASGALTLVVNLQPGYLDSGKFDFAVSGQGFYEGIVPISQSGPHIVHLQGQVAVQAFASDTGPVRQTTLKMEGIVDTSDDSANINIWADGMHYIPSDPVNAKIAGGQS